jgi:hypothetical protein
MTRQETKKAIFKDSPLHITELMEAYASKHGPYVDIYATALANDGTGKRLVRVLHADAGGKVISDLFMGLDEATEYAETVLRAVELAATL